MIQAKNLLRCVIMCFMLMVCVLSGYTQGTSTGHAGCAYSSLTVHTSCFGELPYVWNGLSITVEGYDTAHLTGVGGCDSMAVLYLFVYGAQAQSVSYSLCQGDSVIFDNRYYKTTGTFLGYDTVGGGCVIVDTLHLIINNYPTLNDTVISCGPYQRNPPYGSTVFIGGDWPYTYTSMTGCDSIINVHLTILQNSSSADTLTACDSLTWHGSTYRSTGTYIYHTSNAVGCDSAITLSLTINHTPVVSGIMALPASICSGDTTEVKVTASPFTVSVNNFLNSFATGGRGRSNHVPLMQINLPQAGLIHDLQYQATNYVSGHGIDSIQMAIYDDNAGTPGNLIGTTASQPISPGTVNIHPLQANYQAAAGNYWITFTSNNSLSLQLAIGNITTYNYISGATWGSFPAVGDSTVFSYYTNTYGPAMGIGMDVAPSYQWSPSSSLASVNADSSYAYPTANSQYYVSVTGSGGCTTIDSVSVSVRQKSSTTVTTAICHSTNYAGHDTTGTYVDHYTAANGCDSMRTLHLTVHPVSIKSISASICTGSNYYFGGHTLTSGGIYTDTATSATGCDSIIALHLSILPVSTNTIFVSVCAGSTYNFNGHPLTSAGTYKDTVSSATGCDSIITLHLNILPVSTKTISASICAGSTYPFDGHVLTAAGIYKDTVSSATGCDSIITLQLSIRPVYNDTISASICPGSTYAFDGRSLTTAGTYSDTVTSSTGCDSIVTLNLVIQPFSTSNIWETICPGGAYSFNGRPVSAPGRYTDTVTSSTGCDSIVALYLTVLQVSTKNFSATICSGSAYNFNGRPLSVGGTYLDTVTSSTGCDSIRTLYLTVLPALTQTISVSICAGSSYTFNGHVLTVAGTYIDTLSSSTTCDSIITLHLSILPVSSNTILASICTGSTYNFNGHVLTRGGSYMDTVTSAIGCDSIITLHLSILSVSTKAISASICAGGTYAFNGQVLTSGGIYTDTVSSSTTCDSIITLHLSILPVSTNTISASICAGSTYNFNGHALTSSGTYTDTVSSSTACDSIITLHLSILPVSTKAISASICAGGTYVFNGQVLTTGGNYTDTVTSSTGCDSIITLQLNILPISTKTISASICAGSSYNFNGKPLTLTGVYVDTVTSSTGCDSIATLHLTVSPMLTGTITRSICSGDSYFFDGQQISTGGTYTEVLSSGTNCDSTVTLHLTVNPTYTSTITASICTNDSYNFYGYTLTRAGNYADTLHTINNCDSIINLRLTVLPSRSTTIYDTICNGSSYPFDGQNLDTTGTYVSTLTSVAGCDSAVILHLFVLPALTSTITTSICAGTSYYFNNRLISTGGTYTAVFQSANHNCDSLVTLNLTVNPTYTNNVTASICANSSYNFYGRTLTAAGTYADTLHSVNNCDSIINLQLSVSSTRSTTIYDTICYGGSYAFGGNNADTSGTYITNFTSMAGCDSVVTLHLTVSPAITSTIASIICPGTIYSFNGQHLTIAGRYTEVLRSFTGCDSTVTLDLTVAPSYSSNITESICPHSRYNFYGRILTLGGTYTDTLYTMHGCDSIITLNLIVLRQATSRITQSICAAQSYLGHNTSGTFIDTLPSGGVNGCDSIRTLVLTIRPVVSTATSGVICAGSTYHFNGRAITQSGTYRDTLLSVYGCDSVVILNLANADTFRTILKDTIFQGRSFTFFGNSYAQSGIYADTLSSVSGCDSIINLQLSVVVFDSTITVSQFHNALYTPQHGDSYQWISCPSDQPIPGADGANYTPTQSGSYACVITIGQSSDTTVCFGFVTGIRELSSDNIHVSPNPTLDVINIYATGGQTLFADLMDVSGKIIIKDMVISSDLTTIDLSAYTAGMYLLRITDKEGSKIVVKVVKSK